MNKILKLVVAALLIGFLNAAFYLAVEFVDVQGTNYVWNEFFNTNENRLMVIPVAIFLSIIFSSIIILLKKKRIGKIEVNLLDEGKIDPTSLKEIFKVFIIGSAGLLAGASLGPEGVLVAISVGIGVWIAQRSGKMESAKLLILSSVGALLVGFFGSLLPILIPVLILYKKEKKIIPLHLIPPIVAGITTFIALYIIKNGNVGFGSIPTGSTYNFQDIIASFILGVVGAFFAVLIKYLIVRFQTITKKINSSNHWIISAAIFGGVIGILYFVGGEAIQFSGKEGTIALLNNSYTMGVLIIMILAKFIATSWSLPAGYKGGLVFPSVFMAVALSQIMTHIHPILGGPGITIGATSGMMTSMIPPVMGFVLVLSMIPLNFIILAVAGLLGVISGKKTIDNLIAPKFNLTKN